MKKYLNKAGLLMTMFLFVFAIAACQYDKDEIVLGEGDWESNAFHNQIAKFIIEEGYGIDVRVSIVDTPLLITSLEQGSIHANIEMWSDNIPTYHEDLANEIYHEIAVNFNDNYQGLYIPQYLADANPGLKTIQDLPDYKHLFPDPEVTNWNPESHKAIVRGGPSGWNITTFFQMKFTNEQLYPELVEHFNFRPSESTTLLNTTLISAYQDEQPWIGYNWEPTWIMGQLDMVLLGDDLAYDPTTGAGNPPTQDVTVVVTSGFDTDYPEIYAFLSRYETSSAITAAGLAFMEEFDVSAAEAAQWWLMEYVELWSQWVPEDVKNAVLEALDA